MAAIFTEPIFTAIPHKVDHPVITVYYNYENDRDGQYNLLLGARVSSIDEVPMGMIALHVPSEKRSVF